MKKILLLCMFIVLSLGVSAKKIKSDGKPNFEKILWELWNVEMDSTGKLGGSVFIFQIVKVDEDYYLTDSYYPKDQKKNIKKADRSNWEKLKVYKDLYLMDNRGNIYGYDLLKKKPVIIDKDLNIIAYYVVYDD